MKRENAVKTLLDLKKILDDANVKFWLTCGVLLGAVRDGDFILYDKDIDLMVLAKDWRPEILSKLEEGGFLVRNPVLLAKRNIRIDIFPYCYFAPKKVYVHPRKGIKRRTWLREIPRDWLETETFIEFLGEKFRIPAKSEKFLESIYGSTWKTPQQRWKQCRKGIIFQPMLPEKFIGWLVEHEKKNLWWRPGLIRYGRTKPKIETRTKPKHMHRRTKPK